MTTVTASRHRPRALRRLLADAGSRRRAPLRVVVAFRSGDRPIARLADLALALPRS